MTVLRAALLAALCLFSFGQISWAEDVTLRSRDGAIELSGTLLGFDGEFYRLQTQFGEMTVDGSGVLCEGPGCPSLTDYVAEISISGSATIGAVLLPALVEAFAIRNGLVAKRETTDPQHFFYVLRDPRADKTVGRFAFRVTNTDEGFADLLADEADIVMAMREIRVEEARLASDAGLGDLTRPNRSRVLALDAIVPVVASSNPVREITLSDLRDVLTGEIRDWRRLGGPNAPLDLHLRDVRSGLSQGLEDRLLGSDRTSIREDALRHSSNAALSEAVERAPFGLGLVSFSQTGATSALVLGGDCGFKLRSSRRTIKTEDYPLTAPMFLYIPARRLPALARDFLSFTRSDAAQIVIRRAGFVDQSPEEITVDLQGDRLANAVQVAEGGKRIADGSKAGANACSVAPFDHVLPL